MFKNSSQEILVKISNWMTNFLTKFINVITTFILIDIINPILKIIKINGFSLDDKRRENAENDTKVNNMEMNKNG